jgi:hypothetical protein
MQDRGASEWWEVYVADPEQFGQAFGARAERGAIFRHCPAWALHSEAHDLARGLGWRPIERPTVPAREPEVRTVTVIEREEVPCGCWCCPRCLWRRLWRRD